LSKLTVAQIAGVDVEAAERMSRPELIRFLIEASEMVRRLANLAAADSSNSSRSPSSDPPWRRDRAGKPAAGEDQAAASAAPKPDAAAATEADKKPEKPSGKRPGTPGFWRRQPLVVHEDVPDLRRGTAAQPLAVNRDMACRPLAAHPVAQHALQGSDIQSLEQLTPPYSSPSMLVATSA
jgi:hypothetical protein